MDWILDYMEGAEKNLNVIKGKWTINQNLLMIEIYEPVFFTYIIEIPKEKMSNNCRIQLQPKNVEKFIKEVSGLFLALFRKYEYKGTETDVLVLTRLLGEGIRKYYKVMNEGSNKIKEQRERFL